MTDATAAHSPSRGRIIGARVLLVVGVVLLVVIGLLLVEFLARRGDGGDGNGAKSTASKAATKRST